MEEKMRSFTGYMLQVIEELKLEERFGTAHVYRYALRAYTDFAHGGEIFFGALSRRSLKRFENYLRDKLCSWNTVSTYLRALRSVYNRAVDADFISGEYRLFSAVFTGVRSEHKRALQADEMHRLLDDNESGSKELSGNVVRARNLLSLMLHLQGMPFADLVHLHRDDLRTTASGDIILSCRRRKTGTELLVSITDDTMHLINLYRSTDPSSPYLLCFFDRKQTGAEAYREYCRQLRLLNYGLSKLPGYCGLTGVKVSSYTARHTWATLAKYCHVPEEIISEGLGHSSLEVTRTYLKSFDGDELAKANRMIIDYIYSGKKQVWR